MTRTEFLDALARYAPQYRWHIGEVTGELRGYTVSTFCPITAVVFARTHAFVPSRFAVTSANAYINLDCVDGWAIERAADKHPQHDPLLRQALLTAVGLEEPCGWPEAEETG